MYSWSDLGWTATPGKVHRRSKFSPFVYNGYDRVRWSPKALEMSMQPFPH